MEAEKTVLSAAVKHAKSLGCLTLRLSFRPGVSAGWPDLLVLGRGARVLFMECKATGKKASPLQLHVMGKLDELGFATCICDSQDAARGAIAQAMA